jgi:hypothetical protein
MVSIRQPGARAGTIYSTDRISSEIQIVAPTDATVLILGETAPERSLLRESSTGTADGEINLWSGLTAPVSRRNCMKANSSGTREERLPVR